MTVEERASVKMAELLDAYEFVSFSDYHENEAYICRKTGRIILVSEGIDLDENINFPSGLQNLDYLAVPNQRDLQLGSRIVFSFVEECTPEYSNLVRSFFAGRGAFSRFKQLLQSMDKLDSWYAFEAHAIETALEDWCKEAGVILANEEARG